MVYLSYMIKVVYSDKQVADSGSEASPSATKPKWMAELLRNSTLDIEFIEPDKLTIDDFKLCHDQYYVDDVLNLKRPNGFGTFSQSVVDSLPYTNGAMYKAVKVAIDEKIPVAALVSGFHHAGYGSYRQFGNFCTFNGLMIAAVKLIKDGYKKIAIIDCDMHWGNGTDNILDILDMYRDKISNISFGRYFHEPRQATAYLGHFKQVRKYLIDFKPDVIIYQSGADVHINDPFGGVLTEEQMYKRDVSMFTIAKELNIPIAWNLAGGYQVDEKGSYDFVLQLHMNTFKACVEIYK